MEPQRLFDGLERGGESLRGLLAPISEEDAARRPPSGGWTVREILGHLLSEETEDFRARVEFTLDPARTAWPMLDPEKRVREGGFNERTKADLLAAFLAARKDSLAWLRSLRGADWKNGKEHPRGGVLRAGDFLASWVAHDMLHARQVAKNLHAFAVEDGAPFSTNYAGDW